jgi:hypothetical protein
MFDHVVVGVTPSAGADAAVRRAMEVTQASGGTLHLVMAYRVSAPDVNALPDDFRWSVSSDNPVDELLRAFAATAQAQQVRVVSHPVTAAPVEALVQVARNEQADLSGRPEHQAPPAPDGPRAECTGGHGALRHLGGVDGNRRQSSPCGRHAIR